MKSILIAAALFVTQLSFSQVKNPNSIKVTYVDCSIETFFAIPCHLFETEFPDDRKYIQIKNSEIIKSKAFVKGFTKIKRNHIDTRGKIEYILNGRKYKYCFDCFGVFTDGIHFYNNSQLFKLLKSKCRELNY